MEYYRSDQSAIRKEMEEVGRKLGEKVPRTARS